MSELKPIYNSKIICPVCEQKIHVTKVRSRFVKLLKQDSDFCPYYETINPIFYEAWVCSNCGYAAHSTIFNEALQNDKKMVLEKITPKWTSRHFTGERDFEQALEAFKIVLYNLQVRDAPYFEFAKVCLRIAWLYRYTSESAYEQKFLKYSFDYYKDAYTGEGSTGSTLDEFTCMYIIGDLGRRLGLTDESMVWFSNLISAASNPKKREKIPPVILENAREQIYQIRKASK